MKINGEKTTCYYIYATLINTESVSSLRQLNEDAIGIRKSLAAWAAL